MGLTKLPWVAGSAMRFLIDGAEPSWLAQPEDAVMRACSLPSSVRLLTAQGLSQATQKYVLRAKFNLLVQY